jgi:hypothetical protein
MILQAQGNKRNYPCCGRGPMLGDYYLPETYAYISDTTWETTKVKISNLLHLSSPKEIRQAEYKIGTGEDLFGMIGKIANVTWKPKNKKDIVAFFKNEIIRLLDYQGFLKEKDKENVISEYGCPRGVSDNIYLPNTMLWAMHQLDKKEGMYFSFQVWNKLTYDNEYDIRMRHTILKNMDSLCLKEPQIRSFLTQIRNSSEWKDLSLQDLTFFPKMIEHILIKSALIQEPNQDKRLKFLYQALKEKKEIDIFNNQEDNGLSEIANAMNQVPDMDLTVFFKAIENSKEKEEQYWFLYLFSRRLYLNINQPKFSKKEKKNINRLKKQVNRFYTDNPSLKALEEDKDAYFLHYFSKELKLYETQ